MNSFRGLLLELSNALTRDELNSMKYVCKELIPAGRAERIERPHEFFSELEKLNKLGDNNREFLASILVNINRTDLRNKLLGIRGELSWFLYATEGKTWPSPMDVGYEYCSFLWASGSPCQIIVIRL